MPSGHYGPSRCVAIALRFDTNHAAVVTCFFVVLPSAFRCSGMSVGAALMAAGGASSGGTNQEVVSVPNSMVGLVIGKGGENIRVIQLRTGAHVQIQKDSETEPGATERKVYLSGSASVIEAAKQGVYCIRCRFS